MTGNFRVEDITPGPVSNSSGHEAYLKAIYKPTGNKIIYKKNKHGCADFSRLEVTFSQLARLFLLPNLTPNSHLVIDEGKNVLGLAIEHLSHVIAKKEGLEHSFYTLTNSQQLGCGYTKVKVDDSKDIPINFLNNLPQGFYAHLVEDEAKGILTIDYESLASILSTSYTLEEDDLHKGNFGFYLVEKDSKPHAVFFKIDHDLMFVDSIMGFQTRRPFHLTHGAHAFDITVDDLMSLACLKNSCNSYWPTKFGYIANPFDNKEYRNYADIDAFASLSNNDAFIKAKWKSFYKHILIPTQLIEQTLNESRNMKKASDRAQVALVTQTLTARLARLRAVLFSIKEFRDYVSQLNEQETKALLKEILLPHSPNETLIQQVQESIVRYKQLCHEQFGFENGDTPLHTAIKMGEYRYEETISMFGQFINVKNKEGKTPLDVALERVHTFRNDQNVGKNAYFIMKHLLDNGARKTNLYKLSDIDSAVKAYRYSNPYLQEIRVSMSYGEFKRTLRSIGEDHRFCLKFQKNLAVECIKRFIEVNKQHPNFENRLLQLRDDINGYSSDEESAGVKYIRQLRSKLWIIRQLRGLYGWTSTQWEINSTINQALAQHKAKEPSCFSFFSSKPQRGHVNRVPELDNYSSLMMG
ncbi:Dot/Icm T4SS effector AnkK/LegA5 [Legionella longbeachae]|uniref:Substrate of the Dot/Icm secretion system n=1 Tax=Legionella longbeachae serogroup 1 (strain NSW150) TaxID=661367 RepID=D3HPT9_LEGLN|nr:Dot/Icm T4SS effector AnkK/LegA5 [Legionella longbeachae]QIN34718.1 ankyrin repeat domain-containing protein [Legionella longbeachae]CBJ10903.1 substrate of the Dot/Icm secretion system [Legionella longbeachae NSW150]